MKKPSELDRRYALTRHRVIGLGERTVRKSYYPQLRQRLLELERFRFLLDHTRDLILVVRLPEGRIADFNLTATRLTGYSPEELAGLQVEALLPAFSPPPAPRAAAPGELPSSRTLVTSLQRRHAEPLPVEVSVATAHWDQRLCALIVARDISERQRAAEALRESELRYRALFEESPISLWEEDFSALKRHLETLAEQGVADFRAYFTARPEETMRCMRLIRVREVNRATLALYEARTKEELLTGLDQIVPEGSREVFIAQLEAVAAGRMFEVEGRNRTLSGRPIEVLVKSSVPPGEEGTWGRVFISVYDLTERIQAETEKKILEKQLRQAQKMEAVGTLAGGIAHDFNNILSAVIGFAEMAMDETPPESSTRHSMQQVLQAGLRAKNLVKQILAFSRQTEQALQPVQMRKVVQEAGELLRASLPTTIEIRREVRSNAFVLADPTQMHQVLMNLCTNAAHAMRERGGRLTIGLEDLEVPPAAPGTPMELLPGAYLRLTVQDTGVGIPADHLERIFDPFFTTKGVGEGTGMGLSVVHGIVKAHGGSIGVTSTVGRGSAFTVLLPAITSTNEQRLERPTAAPGGSERILLVDDEAMLVQMTAQLLERLGYRVAAETSSPRALERFRAAPGEFDLVITDMTMPGVTGKDLARELLGLRPRLPVILCTGFSDAIDEATAREMGIRAFIMKPIVMRELAETVRRVLDGAQGADAAEGG